MLNREDRRAKKPKIKSQTLWVNALSGILGAIAMGIISMSHELQTLFPGWPGITLLVISNAYNFWRRMKTDEAVK